MVFFLTTNIVTLTSHAGYSGISKIAFFIRLIFKYNQLCKYPICIFNQFNLFLFILIIVIFFSVNIYFYSNIRYVILLDAF